MEPSQDIAVIAWGSLIWDPRQLDVRGPWHDGGPTLPVEFCRISANGRLTLVVNRDLGWMFETKHATSRMQSVRDAVENLAHREGTSSDQIAFVDIQKGTSSRGRGLEDVHWRVEEWCRERSLQGAIWTALATNFSTEFGEDFSPENALKYLRTLSDDKRALAIEYISGAPKTLSTPVRALFDSEEWG